MGITMMGSIHDFAKTQKLQTQWNQKKESGNVTSHKKSMDEWLRSTSSSQKDEDDGGKLQTIQTKIYMGKKLTNEEKEYLKNKDPQAYSDLENNEREQRAYERKLKQCKTKEEVQRLKMTHLGASLSRVNAVKNDPAIPAEKKLEIMANEQNRCDRLEKSTQKFIQSGAYDKLPTDGEMRKAEAEEAAKDTAKTPETTPDQPQKTPEEADAPREVEAKPETCKPEAPKPAKTDVEYESPELRKARRAKAKAAFAQIGNPQDTTAPVLDVKA